MKVASIPVTVAVAAVLSMARTALAQDFLTLVHINDHHSHFFESSFDLEGDKVPSGLSVDTQAVRIYYGGASRVSATIQAFRQEAADSGQDICVLHAGDGITGTLYYTLLGTDPDSAVMNAIGYDAFVPGNHEFDDGDANLADFIQKLEFPVTSHNLQPAETSALRQLEGDRAVQPYVIKTLPSGSTIGICGITSKVMTEQSSFPDPGTTFVEEIASAQECVEAVQAEGVDRIILLTHIGFSNDVEKLATIDGVDAIVGGHSHSLLGGEELEQFGLTPQGAYAELIDGTCVVQAWEYSKTIGKVTIEFDENGDVMACTGAPVLPINPDKFTVKDAEEDFDLEGDDVTIVADYLLRFDLFVNYGEDQAIIDIIAPFTAQVEEESSNKIATVPETICHTRGGEVDPLCPMKDELSKVGGGVCPIVARSFIDSVPTADFAIQNAGGCREDILAGDFTFGDAFSVLPFSNTLVRMQMTGDQIHRVLEDAYNFFLDPEIGGGSGSYPIAAGLRWHVDYTKSFGERVTNLQRNPFLLQGQWFDLDPTVSYTIVTNSFIAGSRDGYYTFDEVDKDDPEQYLDTYVEYAQSLVDYAAEKEELKELPLDLISTQVLTLEDGTVIDIRPQKDPVEESKGVHLLSGSGSWMSLVLSVMFGALMKLMV